MSLHIDMTNEAAHAMHIQKIRNMVTAISTAVLSTILGGLLLYTVAIVIRQQDPPSLEAITVNNEQLPPTPAPVIAERAFIRPASADANPPSIISSTAYSPEITIPYNEIQNTDVHDFNESLPLSAEDMGDGVGVDTDWQQTREFGSDVPGGSTLTGTFYDFKQTAAGSPTNITPDQAALLMKDFITGGWHESKFAKYYKSPTKLYNSHIFITRRAATEAPKAFKCEDKVKDSRWCAIYRGKVAAPKSGTFRFVGAGDDAIVVRFDGKNVFDYGWYQLTVTKGGATAGGEYYKYMTGQSKNDVIKKELRKAGIYKNFPVPMYKYTGMNHWNNALGGLATGAEFTVEANKVYPIEILVSEIPGGEMGAILLIEEIGAKDVKKDKQFGSPILPLFRTNYALPEPAKGEAPPFDPVGIIWKAVKS